MSEKYVAEYVEILDDHGERKGVCVTDTEHTVSFEVKDEIAAMELCELLNKQQALINTLKKENKELKEDLKKGFDVPIPYVENSMRRLRAEHKVGELQATIEQLEEEIERLNGLLFGTPKAIE